MYHFSSGCTQETNTVTELVLRSAPRQAAQSELRNALSQQVRRFIARRHRPRLACKHDGFEPAVMARPQRARALIEFDLVALADARLPAAARMPASSAAGRFDFLFAGVEQAIDLPGQGLHLFASIGLRRQGVR